MKIRTKLMVSNIMMILVPVLTGTLIVILGISYMDNRYMYTLNEFFEDENAVISAKSTIYEYQNELWKTDWEKLSDADALTGKESNADDKESTDSDGETYGNFDISDLADYRSDSVQTVKKTKLGAALQKLGYHFAIFKDGDCSYSDMDEADCELINQTLTSDLLSTRSLIISQNDNSMIKSTFVNGDSVCEILAISEGSKEEGKTTVSYLKSTILKLLYVLAAAVLAVVIIMNLILSGWISRSILRPLSGMKKGIEQITRGELDESIALTSGSKKKNEIEEVCEGFDFMRGYLRESAVERVKNEEKRREMISGISHDLRTPLTAIEGYVEGLMSGIASTDEMKKKYLEAIYTRSKELEKMTDRLSYYNKGQERSYEMEEREINEVIAGITAKYQIETDKGRLNIMTDTGDTENCRVMMDEREFQRVFDNLISNSIKYCNSGQCVINISTEMNDGNANIIFEDNGPGVPEETTDKIFDIFYRTDTARSNTGNGSGIGLAIVREIVEAHGGTVNAAGHGELGGLKVTVTLPVAEHREKG
jgi:signal transduction histidine kinase